MHSHTPCLLIGLVVHVIMGFYPTSTNVNRGPWFHPRRPNSPSLQFSFFPRRRGTASWGGRSCRHVPCSLSAAAAIMDLICNAYSNSSDEENDPVSTSIHPEIPLASLKRRRAETETAAPEAKPYSKHQQRNFSNPGMETPIPGRYISKRERAIMDSVPTRVLEQEHDSASATSSGTFFRSSVLFICSYLMEKLLRRCWLIVLSFPLQIWRRLSVTNYSNLDFKFQISSIS